MRKSKIEFKKATPEYAREYYGKRPVKTFKGYVALLNDKVVGIGGVSFEKGNMMAFSEMKDEMRPFRRDIAKAARLLEGFIDSLPYPVFAFACPKEPTAKKLLQKLGFIPTGQETEHGSIFVRY